MEKNLDFKNVEPRLYQQWDSAGLFKPSEKPWSDGRPPFVMSMPPPNVTGQLHMGHAMFVSLQDLLARYHRMRGESTLWLPGSDHAGIATQLQVEKLLNSEGLSREAIGREAFVKRAWQWKEEYGGRIVEQMRRLGASCDWSRQKFTLDDDLCGAVHHAFDSLHAKGLIYRGTYLVNWSPHLQTAVSDLEVDYVEEEGLMYHFRYPVEGGEFLPVATTRPETILGDAAVAVHPDDERYQHLIGKNAVVPTTGRLIPIIADEYVDKDFGSGALKVTPAHDPNDYEIGGRHELQMLSIFEKDGTMNETCGPFTGLDRFEAREVLWREMESLGLVIKTEPHMMRTPRSQRGGEVIEPMLSTQWFLKMEDLAKPALKAVQDGDLTFVPPRFGKIYNHWLGGIRDWCLSRQLWWGHPIPVWYIGCDGSDPSHPYLIARDEKEARSVATDLGHGPEVSLIRDPDVLDTWFSSALWPFATLGWPKDDAEDLKKYYPTSVMETGHDILFFWVARMVMLGIEFTGKVPFHTVYLHGLIRDEEGRKMSKSLGNVIDPLEIVDQYGTDALRFSLLTGVTPGQDINLQLDKVEANRNFGTKVWNLGKFTLHVAGDATPLSTSHFEVASELQKLSLPDRWIVSEYHQVSGVVTAHMSRMQCGEAGRAIYDFIWGELADWYVEAAKSTIKGGSKSNGEVGSEEVLLYVMQGSLKLLHPFMPFVTEELWSYIPRADRGNQCEDYLMVSPWPKEDLPIDQHALEAFGTLREVVRAVRNIKAEYGVSPGKRIPATLYVASTEARELIETNRGWFTDLARIEDEGFIVTVDASSEDVQGAVRVPVREGLMLSVHMADMVDPVKEAKRLNKVKEKLTKEITGLTGRLGSSGFVGKAPPAVVEKAKAELQDLEDRLDVVNTQMENLKA